MSNGTKPTTLGADIQLGKDGKAPKEIRMFRAGVNETDRGYPILFDEIAAGMVMEAYRVDGKERLYADWNHGMLPRDDSRPTRDQGASSCSFIPEIRDGEYWATSIDWTDDGRSDVETKKYNLFSPAFFEDVDSTGNVRPRKVVNFALVNLAGLRNIAPLLAASAAFTDPRETHMDANEIARIQARNAELETEIKVLRASHTEVVALSGVMSLAATAAPEVRVEAVRGLVALRGEVLALTGQENVAGARGVLTGWKQKADGYDALAKEKAEQEATALTAELDGVLTSASKDGKLGFTPGELVTRKAEALKFGAGKPSRDGIDFLKSLSANAPKIITQAGDAAAPPAEGVIALTATEIAAATIAGIKPETMLEQKKRIAAKKAANAAVAAR